VVPVSWLIRAAGDSRFTPRRGSWALLCQRRVDCHGHRAAAPCPWLAVVVRGRRQPAAAGAELSEHTGHTGAPAGAKSRRLSVPLCRPSGRARRRPGRQPEHGRAGGRDRLRAGPAAWRAGPENPG